MQSAVVDVGAGRVEGERHFLASLVGGVDLPQIDDCDFQRSAVIKPSFGDATHQRHGAALERRMI